VLKHFKLETWNNKPVVICGTVEKTASAAKYLYGMGIAPVYICDDDPPETYCDDVEVISLEHLAEHREDNIILGSKVFYRLYEEALRLPYNEMYSMLSLIREPHLRQIYSAGIDHFYQRQKTESARSKSRQWKTSFGGTISCCSTKRIPLNGKITAP
jgi:hypothetical protein